MKRVKALLIGDMCLDVYWFADMTKSVLSRETPHFPLPVVEERMSAGAGGNAAVNMATLCDHLTPVGVMGEDWRGGCLRDVFARHGMPTSGILQIADRVTNAYCKPMRMGFSGVAVEDPRLDFESNAPLTAEQETKLLERLEEAVRDADVLCVSDQFALGCVTDRVRRRINALAGAGLLTVVDSRSRIGLYQNCILKPNEIECARALGLPDGSLGRDCTEEQAAEAARALGEKTGCDVCLTLGARGALICRAGEITGVSAVPVSGPVDTVGAGDCFLSAFSLALAAGADTAEAGEIGCMASAVCVKKLNTTGSASSEELCALWHRMETKDAR